jgi:hypothetical protein
MLASIFPNLQLLDLGSCYDVSEEGIFHVLRTGCKIRHLNLADCVGVKLLGMNFKVPKLEVLDLSCTLVDDETLYNFKELSWAFATGTEMLFSCHREGSDACVR